MKTFRILVALLFVAVTSVSAQDQPAQIELVLKFDPISGDPLNGIAKYKGAFFLVIRQGEAFVAESEVPKAEIDKRKGTVQFIQRNGVDPVTHTFPPAIYELRFRHVGSGWGADKFITDIVVPYSFQERGGKPVVVFSDKATEVQLWEKFRQGSITFIGDAMDVRWERHIACKEISSKLNFVPR